MLATLETSGAVVSSWNMDAIRPRKIYQLTKDGKSILTFAEKSLQTVCNKLNAAPQESTIMLANSEKQLTKIR